MCLQLVSGRAHSSSSKIHAPLEVAKRHHAGYIRDITFGNRTVLGSGVIQYYFQHISDKCDNVKK